MILSYGNPLYAQNNVRTSRTASVSYTTNHQRREACGVTPEIGKLLFVQQFTHHKDDGTVREELEFFFHIKNDNDYTHVDLAATTHGNLELTRCDFIDLAHATVLPEFLQKIDIQSYIDTDKPVFFYDELG